MFHGKELRPNALQPFTRIVAKHIKSLRSQVARAACMAAQKMFTYVPKSIEPVSSQQAFSTTHIILYTNNVALIKWICLGCRSNRFSSLSTNSRY